MAKRAAEPDMDDYRAENDHSTMMRAAEIRSAPSRMAGVKKHHKKMMGQMGKVGKMVGGKR